MEQIHSLKESAVIKDTIEALGIPHPEVVLILVNGESAIAFHLDLYSTTMHLRPTKLVATSIGKAHIINACSNLSIE